jgi:cell division protein FtsB
VKRGWLIALLALALLLAGLQAKLWWGHQGWNQAQSLRGSVARQKEENARLQQRNDALAAEVEDLKSGEDAVEERARSELGMVKPNETFYRVVEPRDGATPDPDALPAPPAEDLPPGVTDPVPVEPVTATPEPAPPAEPTQ